MSKREKVLENESSAKPEGKAVAVSARKKSVNAMRIKKADMLSKIARQAAFRIACRGMSSQEAVAKARLIPDVSQESFKVIRICG